MRKYNVGIKLKSGLGYSTEVEAIDMYDAEQKAVDKAVNNGFEPADDGSRVVIFITQR